MRRGPVAVVIALLAGLVAPVAVTTPATAAIAQGAIVNENPADFTPHVLNGRVNAIAQVGSTIYMGGQFTQVRNAPNGSPTLSRSNLFAFNATTGVIRTDFTPTFDNTITSLLPGADGTSLFVGGQFNVVNGANARKVVKLSTANGSRIAAFNPPAANAIVKDLKLRGNDLLIGGSFSAMGATARTALASVNATTGALTSYAAPTIGAPINGGVTQVYKMDVSPNGSTLVIIGNFTQVNAQERTQIAMFDLGASATLANWRTGFFADVCVDAFDTYMRDIDFSPTGQYFVITTTGAYGGSTSPCDSITRWESADRGTDVSYTWSVYTGGDTTYAVAVTDTAVYVGGHMRWMNNPFAGDAAGPGAVPREGIAALDPLNGNPLSWDPGRARGVGVFDFLATPQGLWMGSDTSTVRNEFHGKLALFPLAGGTAPPANDVGDLPNDVYLLGLPPNAATDPNVFYRVNTGGPGLLSADDGPDWTGDTDGGSPYRNSGSNSAGWDPVPAVDGTLPNTGGDRAPSALFSSERWDPGDAPEMEWSFPVPAGTSTTVRLYFANRYGGTAAVGQRVFDVSVEGSVVLDDFDIVAAVGHDVGTMRSFDVVSDGAISIDFGHLVENPLVNGIELIRQGTGGGPAVPNPALDKVQRRFFNGVTPGPTATVPSSVQWGQARGAFLVDGTVYTPWSDGTLYARSFNGSTFGAAQAVNLYGGSFGGEASNVTGIVYDPADARIYYTLFGDNNLYWRAFTPESRIVGAARFNASGDVGALGGARVSGMFLSGNGLYFADSTSGDLLRVGFDGGVVTGPATTADSSVDWRSRGTFVWNGAPAPGPNDPPTAEASGSCVQLTCTFSSAGSGDTDGLITGYSWTFGDGIGTSTQANPTYTYADGGTFTATLTVTDDRGGTDTDTATVVAVEPPNTDPTAEIDATCAGLSCTFDGSDSDDSDGTIVSWAWTFGDTTGGSGEVINHTYAGAGTYTVNLTVTDDDGGTDTVPTSVTVAPSTSAVGFRVSSSRNINATNATIPLPAGIQAGDALFLFVSNNTGAVPTTGPAGWTLVTQQPAGASSDHRTLLYRKVATAGDAGSTVGVVWPATAKTALLVSAYTGVAPGAAVVASAGETVVRTTHTTPTVSVTNPGSWLLSFWSDKTSTTTAWTAPAGVTTRTSSFGTGGGAVSGLLGDSGGPVGAGTAGGLTATANVSGAKATMWSVVLAPAP